MPLVFIYDRHATEHRAPLDLRLDGCRNWAELHGWEIAGIWLDLGDNALTDGRRPQFDGLCGAMALYAGSREVLCLVHTWDRLTRTGALPGYLRRVAAAGGYTVTGLGEDDRQALAAEGLTAHAGSTGQS
ncbi:recombinase family protein [Streptomyces sp. NPDC102274]|uniref:recombinase family protein n=1 Tax=Streptomyces sp. NPDC102274 TaxID=3366151 RepID=UPI003827A371